MQDYTVHRCTKRCRKSSRPLAPGEWFYSVVERKTVNFIRYDIAISQWNGPPKHAIAWWKSQMPEAKAVPFSPTPNSILLERLRELCDDPAQQTLAYLLAMLLVRRRVLEYDTSAQIAPDQTSEEMTDRSIVLRCVADRMTYCVNDLPAELPEDELMRIQAVLQEQLIVQAHEEVGQLIHDEETSMHETENSGLDNNSKSPSPESL